MLPHSGKPSTVYVDTAADKSTLDQLPNADTLSPEINMSDATFDAGLKKAVYRVNNVAVVKSPSVQTNDTDTRRTQNIVRNSINDDVHLSKRVRSKPKRFIQQY